MPAMYLPWFTDVNRKYGKCSALAKEVWQIKDKGGIYNINWGVIGHAAAYNSVSKWCNLCLLEKLYIAENTGESLLNQRNELISKCQHKNKYAVIYHNPTQSDSEVGENVTRFHQISTLPTCFYVIRSFS